MPNRSFEMAIRFLYKYSSRAGEESAVQTPEINHTYNDGRGNLKVADRYVAARRRLDDGLHDAARRDDDEQVVAAPGQRAAPGRVHFRVAVVRPVGLAVPPAPPDLCGNQNFTARSC